MRIGNVNTGKSPSNGGVSGLYPGGGFFGLFDEEPTKKPTAEEVAENALRKARKETLRIELSQHNSDKKEIVKEMRSIGRTFEKDRKIFSKVKICFFGMMILVCSSLLGTNGARFVLDTTQSWMLAILFSAILPIGSIALEINAGKLVGNRNIVDRTIAWLLLLSLATFVFRFAQEFAYAPDLGDMASLLGGEDLRLIFIAQTVSEFCGSYCLTNYLKKEIAEHRIPTVNPEWQRLKDESEALDRVIYRNKVDQGRLLKETALFEEKSKRAKEQEEKIKKVFNA